MEVPLITYYSAVVATISLIVAGSLAIIKIIEYRRDSRGLSVSYAWTGNPNDSDKIFLMNLSAIPMLVRHWSLEWHEPRILRKPKITPIRLYDDEDLHITLEPRKRHTLEFSEQYRFNWFPKNKKQSALYIRLLITGKRKPILLNVI